MNTSRRLRPIRLLLAAALSACALLTIVATAGAADNGRLYWVTGSGTTVGTAGIATPASVTGYAAGVQANGVFASSSALYWTSPSPTGQIVIANLAGHVQGAITPGGTSNPTGVVAVGPYIYWADNGFIGRALTTGGSAQVGVQWYSTPGVQYTAIWADANYLYFASATQIGRIALNGTGANPSFVNNETIVGAVNTPTALASDANRVYWINSGATSISSANVATGQQITPSYLGLPNAGTGLAQTGNAFYWSNASGGYVGAANLSPAVTNSTFINTASTPTDIAATRYALTVSKAGAGAASSIVSATSPSTTQPISCGSQCTADLADMAPVTLTATPATGYEFGGWTGACTGAARTCAVTMNQAQSVTATFNVLVTSYTLTLTKKGTGAGSIVSSPVGLNCGAICAAPFAKNAWVTLTAVEGANSDFTGWSGACSGYSVLRVCYVKMTKARAASATFNPAPVLALTKFGLSRTTFRVGSRSTAVRAYTPVGTTIKYTLSESANVTVSFQKPGYRKKYSLYRASGKTGAKSGANAISFSGRVGRTKLAPGRWKAIITASDGTKTTKAQVKYFTIKK
ncbi:MAG: InlB B-repeat-containing protein [Gaiellales bacterium]